MRECFDVGMRFNDRAVSPHAHEVLILLWKRGPRADPTIAFNDNAGAFRRLQGLVVIECIKGVATFHQPVIVRRNYCHQKLVVSRVRATMHATQVDSVVDVYPKVGPLVEVLKIGEVSASVGMGKRNRYAIGVYNEDDMWRRRWGWWRGRRWRRRWGWWWRRGRRR